MINHNRLNKLEIEIIKRTDQKQFCNHLTEIPNGNDPRWIRLFFATFGANRPDAELMTILECAPAELVELKQNAKSLYDNDGKIPADLYRQHFPDHKPIIINRINPANT